MKNSADTKRKQKLIGFGGLAAFVLLLVFGMWMSDPNRGKPNPLELARMKGEELKADFTVRSSSSVSAQETWIALSEQQIKELQAQDKALDDKLNQILAAINSQGTGKTETRIVERPQQVDKPASGLPPAPAKQDEKPPAQELIEKALPQPPRPQPAPASSPSGYSVPRQPAINKDGKPVSMIQVVSLTDENKAGQEKKKKAKNISHYLPAGSFSTAVLLSGLDAPTGGQAASNPVPVLLRLMDDGRLPNYFNSDVESCHVLGAGYGDISMERAHIRLESLTCVLSNGDIVEEKVKGYVAGEDGKAGMRGKLISKQGALIARSLLAGIASGMGASVSEQYQQVSTSALGNVTTIDPDKTVETGLATGTANALEKIADFYLARASETYPIIEVDANRIGEVIFTAGTDLGRNLIGNTKGGNNG